jgi:type I restriction enzyme S subunit
LSFINYLDTGNITENFVFELQHLLVGRDKIPSRARRKIHAGDIVYSTVRPNQKHYGIIKNPAQNMLASTGFAVLSPKPTVADNDYIYYYLTQEKIVQKLHAIAEQSTSAYPSVKPSDIGALEITLPPLHEQKVISGILAALDEKIFHDNKINDYLPVCSPVSPAEHSPGIRRSRKAARRTFFFAPAQRLSLSTAPAARARTRETFRVSCGKSPQKKRRGPRKAPAGCATGRRKN